MLFFFVREDIIPHNEKVSVHDEYSSFMIAATSLIPYNSDTLESILDVQHSLAARRKWIEDSLNQTEMLFTLSAFPTLGVGHCIFPYSSPNGPITQSKMLPDSVVNPKKQYKFRIGHIIYSFFFLCFVYILVYLSLSGMHFCTCTTTIITITTITDF